MRDLLDRLGRPRATANAASKPPGGLPTRPWPTPSPPGWRPGTPPPGGGLRRLDLLLRGPDGHDYLVGVGPAGRVGHPDRRSARSPAPRPATTVATAVPVLDHRRRPRRLGPVVRQGAPVRVGRAAGVEADGLAGGDAEVGPGRGRRGDPGSSDHRTARPSRTTGTSVEKPKPRRPSGASKPDGGAAPLDGVGAEPPVGDRRHRPRGAPPGRSPGRRAGRRRPRPATRRRTAVGGRARGPGADGRHVVDHQVVPEGGDAAVGGPRREWGR